MCMRVVTGLYYYNLLLVSAQFPESQLNCYPLSLVADSTMTSDSLAAINHAVVLWLKQARIYAMIDLFMSTKWGVKFVSKTLSISQTTSASGSRLPHWGTSTRVFVTSLLVVSSKSRSLKSIYSSRGHFLSSDLCTNMTTITMSILSCTDVHWWGGWSVQTVNWICVAATLSLYYPMPCCHAALILTSCSPAIDIRNPECSKANTNIKSPSRQDFGNKLSLT